MSSSVDNICFPLSDNISKCNCVAFDPIDSSILYTGHDGGKICIWNYTKQQDRPTKEIDTRSLDRINSMKIHPRGEYLAWSTEIGAIRIWDLKHDCWTQSPYRHSCPPLLADPVPLTIHVFYSSAQYQFYPQVCVQTQCNECNSGIDCKNGNTNPSSWMLLIRKNQLYLIDFGKDNHKNMVIEKMTLIDCHQRTMAHISDMFVTMECQSISLHERLIIAGASNGMIIISKLKILHGNYNQTQVSLVYIKQYVPFAFRYRCCYQKICIDKSFTTRHVVSNYNRKSENINTRRCCFGAGRYNNCHHDHDIDGNINYSSRYDNHKIEFPTHHDDKIQTTFRCFVSRWYHHDGDRSKRLCDSSILMVSIEELSR